jgi:glycosyltransferase involved in cell wall biosynthesis
MIMAQTPDPLPASDAPTGPDADWRANTCTGSAAGLRVALYSGNYNSVRDGANKALHRLIGHVLDNGGAARVYSPIDHAVAFPSTGDLVEVPSVPIPGRPEYRVTYGLSKQVRDDIIAFRPNLIHVSVPDFTGWQAQSMAREMGLPIVASLHTRFETYLDYYRMGFLRGFGERYLARFYSRCDLVLAPNEVLAEEVRKGSPGVRTSIWSRGVDATMFTSARRDFAWRAARGYGENDVVVAFFGRLVLEKGTAIFVRIIEELRARGHRVVPLLIGEGPERDKLTEALGEAVFTGHVEGDELGRAVASADIMVNPSVTEAFGNVSLEAMAAGLVVVAADVPVSRAMIEHGRTGLLANSTNATEFADRIERLLLEPAFRAQLRTNALAETARYDWTAILESVVADYQAVVKAGPHNGA